MKLTKSQLREIIKEELLNESVDDKKLADAFTRYLMGDWPSAITQLSNMGGSFKFTMETPGTKEYNNQYNDVYNSFLKLLKKIK